MIDTKLNRLKLEGTPRIKRERRTPAPPLSPIPITSDFSDFMLPNFDGDYGTLAKSLMDQINSGTLTPGLDGFSSGIRGSGGGGGVEEMSPPSPSPGADMRIGMGMLGEMPVKLENEEDDGMEVMVDQREGAIKGGREEQDEDEDEVKVKVEEEESDVPDYLVHGFDGHGEGFLTP